LGAEEIIGRMTSDSEIMQSYRSQAVELQKFGLDEAIEKEAMHEGFRPIVHAEILLLDSLVRDGGTHPSEFFNGYKYIGCSKPSCRLCDYYFSIHSSGVQIRPTHQNMYLSWRMPDLFEDQGLKAKRERGQLMDKILLLIRKDAFRLLREKSPQKKKARFKHGTNNLADHPNLADQYSSCSAP